MRTIIFIIVFYNLINAQTLDKEYRALAKYFILRNCIEEYGDYIPRYNPIDNNIAWNKIKYTITTDSFDYEVSDIYHFRKCKVILLIDKTNLRLHGLYNSFFIYDTLEYVGYSEINQSNINQYINEHLMNNLKYEERDKIIELYNSIYFYPKISMHHKIEFYDSINYDSFSELENVINFSDLFKFRESWDNRIYQSRVYKKYVGDEFIEYYQVDYFFECNKFYVLETLLLKEKV